MLTKKQMEEFFKRLEGPEGCDFQEDKKGKITWKCKAGTDKSHSKKILKKMKVGKEQADKFLQECDDNGGHCDCEILFNAAERMLQKCVISAGR